MSNNDQKRNQTNLLFKPNNAIDDGQPAFLFYSTPQTPPQNIPPNIPSIPQVTQSEIIGQPQNQYQPPPGIPNFVTQSEINIGQPQNQCQLPLGIPNFATQSGINIGQPQNQYKSPLGIQNLTLDNNVATTSVWESQSPILFGDNYYRNDPELSISPVPLFSAGEPPIRATIPEPPQSGSINNYRRTGNKRPVYAQIPGLINPGNQNQCEQTGKFTPPIQHQSPNIFTPTQSTYTTPKVSPQNLFKPIDSSQSNSPFLNPVTEIPELPSSNTPPSRLTPTMSTKGASDLQFSTSSLMYPGDSSLLTSPEVVNTAYRPPYHHWFYKKEAESRITWEPFSMIDSLNLESNFTSPDLTPEKNIPTDGGRYDVNILRRQRNTVYWDSKPSEVRRCSWFHKGHTDGKYMPFEENIATKLEEEYRSALESSRWHKKVSLPNGEVIMFHAADVFVLFSSSQMANISENASDGQVRPRIVKRGMDEYNIDEGESEAVDHLLFMVHGIGEACDLKFRSVAEVVEEFRSVALQLVRTHYRSSCDKKLVNRVEVLPISWHDKLHSEDTGIDKKLRSITLESIPKLREFTNDTLLDILFYTSPIYGQTIINSVGNELNRVYDLFKLRNPNFKGGVSLAGHSLGSLILFDILCNQSPVQPEEQEDIVDDLIKPPPLDRKMSRRVSYMMGKVGTGQAQINYPHLNFEPVTFFALGSPIGMFVTVRGLDSLGEKFQLPTCAGFFNIFHPYDPVAYRIESLINPQLANIKPVLIPHHKGRKRMHLELKETMAKVGSDLKQKLVDSMKNTWNSIFQLGWSNSNTTNKSIQPAIADEVDKVLEQFATKHTIKENEEQSVDSTGLSLGILNQGRRIDYVLQEAPVEFFNEYIFALSSHVCYWESEDTVLLILKEIYNVMNIAADSQIPQQTMTIERPPPTSRSPDIASSSSQGKMGVDPTAPMRKDKSVGPPPLSGFFTKEC